MRLLILALVPTVFFAGCAQYATVAEKRPQFTPVRSTVGALVKVEQGIVGALKVERREPLVALGGYLASAESAAQQLALTPGDEGARTAYNFAVARIFGTLQAAKLEPWTQPVRVPAADGGEYVLTHRRDARKAWNPALYDFTPADQFDVKGTYVSDRTRKEGVGATLVAVGRGVNADAQENFTMERTYYGVTGVARFRGRQCTLAFEDPLAAETTTLNGHTFPLAADFTVPLAVMLAQTNPKKLELARLLRPEKYAETARISRLQPYDPNKTVVLIIHGLADTPATWAPMLNNLRGDARIRGHFQFWFYSYPSGYPYPYSAAILRRELEAVEKKFPLRKKMVVIGHSMGGCISRLLITDAEEKLWLKTFGKPPGQVSLSPESKRTLEDALIFRHRPEVGRVIFISAPLRGSDLASGWLGRFASSLVRSPVTLLKVGAEALQIGATDSSVHLKRIPNSVDTLSPDNGFVKNINTLPLTPGIPYHVISGDRGKGGNKDHTPPVMSDGVVPYWSSHMDSAQSELVVPSSHSAHQNKQAIAEVNRILKQHSRR